MAITICDLCAKRKICIDKNKFYPVVKCQNYHGGEAIKVPQTNEEWLRSCTTEELVKMILDLCDDRPCFACGIGYCEDENWCHVYSDEAKEFVMEWLKQPHTPIS